MPTGYTAGILDGKTKTFNQFAKDCSRAFGAMMHLRDEQMDSPYQQRTPSGYYAKAMKRDKALLKLAKNSTDEQLIEYRTAEINKDLEYHETTLVKRKEDRVLLDKFIVDVQNWEPPTPDHVGLKDFMLDQLKQTINFDADPKYHEENIERLKSELKDLTADKIRSEMILKANKDLKYHTEEHNKELDRCNQSNKWASQLFDSLD